MDNNHQISYEIEGLPNEDGHVRLADLVERLSSLQAAINAVNTAITGRGNPTLYYRVVGASHNSPVRFMLQMVERPDLSVESKLDETKIRFINELNRLEAGEPPSESLGNEAIDKLNRLVSWDRKRFKSVKVGSGTTQIDLHDKLRDSMKEYLLDEEESWGELSGKIMAIDLHGRTKHFHIYPVTGEPKIRCVFMPGLKEEAKRAIEHRVVVYGKKYFRRNQKLPHRIDVSEIEIQDDAQNVPHLVNFKGAVTDGEPSVEGVMKLRDEW